MNSQEHLREVKRQRSHPGFELASLILFPYDDHRYAMLKITIAEMNRENDN